MTVKYFVDNKTYKYNCTYITFNKGYITAFDGATKSKIIDIDSISEIIMSLPKILIS